MTPKAFGAKEDPKQKETTLMKTKLIRRIMGSLLVGLASVTMLAATAAGQRTGGGRIQGTWDGQVTIRDCQTGYVIGGFESLTTFHQGGTMMDGVTNTPPALRTPGAGVWSQIGNNTYAFHFKFFTFDAQNNLTGWRIVTQYATVDPTGNAFTSYGTADIYNPNGVLVLTVCPEAVGTRFEL
jgi:hypothetical protein